MFKFVVKLLALVLLAGSAAAMPPAATPMDADRVHVELADLNMGRDLLVTKCGASSHATPLPAQYARIEWPRKLGEMSERAGLVSVERALIEQYTRRDVALTAHATPGTRPTTRSPFLSRRRRGAAA